MARSQTGNRDGDDGLPATPATILHDSPWPRCAWETQGRQCFLLGDVSPDQGERPRRYCHWHYVNLGRRRFAEDEKEFRRWLESWRGSCSVENHYDAARIWDALLGISDLDVEPRWCGNLICRVVPNVQSAKWIAEGRGNPPATQIDLASLKPAGPFAPIQEEVPF